jgi:hypothetical protein
MKHRRVAAFPTKRKERMHVEVRRYPVSGIGRAANVVNDDRERKIYVM